VPWLALPPENAVKGTFAIKGDAAEAIETSVPDKGCTLFRDVNQPSRPAAGGIIAAGRAIKNGIGLGSWRGYERQECNRDPEQANAMSVHIQMRLGLSGRSAGGGNRCQVKT
jgi:hypothetical protein